MLLVLTLKLSKNFLQNFLRTKHIRVVMFWTQLERFETNYSGGASATVVELRGVRPDICCWTATEASRDGQRPRRVMDSDARSRTTPSAKACKFPTSHADQEESKMTHVPLVVNDEEVKTGSRTLEVSWLLATGVKEDSICGVFLPYLFVLQVIC
jgi:hypothetical protein